MCATERRPEPAGDHVTDRRLARRWHGAGQPEPGRPGSTDRERELVALDARGLSNDEIATRWSSGPPSARPMSAGRRPNSALRPLPARRARRRTGPGCALRHAATLTDEWPCEGARFRAAGLGHGLGAGGQLPDSFRAFRWRRAPPLPSGVSAARGPTDGYRR